MTGNIIKFCTLAFLALPAANLTAQDLKWEKAAAGVWKTVAGIPEKTDLFNTAGIEPSYEALSRLGSREFPINPGLIDATVADGKTLLRFPLERGEEIFGLGLNFKTVHQRGRIMQLHVDHYGGSDNGRTHAPVPFWVSSKGYGVFINSSRYLTVYAGTGVRKDSPEAPVPLDRNTDRNWTSQPYSDAVEIVVPAEGCEIFVFEGPTALDAVRRFNLYSGGGCLPPRWGLGFTQRVPTLYNSEKVISEAKMFGEKGFPLDFIGLEPGWQSKSYPCTFAWDKSRFPDPPAFVQAMKEMGIRINLWTNPYVSPESPVYKAILPFTGTHTVWGGVVPDLTMAEARQLITGLFEKDHISAGVSGYKIDESDGYDRWLWPDVALFPSGTASEQMRQVYGLLLQRMTTDMFRKANKRTYGLTRASNGGSVSFPYVIYNDYYSHPDFITALINSGFIGVLWTPEVRSSGSSEEWLRRFQSVVFSPMAMINAWSSGTQPWTFPDVEKEIREYSLLRMQLMPYLYSEFAKYHFEGTPPFRAMNLEPGFGVSKVQEENNLSLSENPYAEATQKEIKDQYMTGEYLLVAPMFAGQVSRKVILPEGKWFDFYSGEYAGSGEIITVSPGISKIPVFVKDGAIVPMMTPRLHAPAAGEKYDLEIRYYGTRPGIYMLYDDDGETFDYEKGVYSWRELKVSRDKKGQPSGTLSKPVKGKPDNIGQVTWRIMTKQD